MYVYEEMVDGQKLTEIINTKHENVKYLPGCIIPANVVSLIYLIYRIDSMFHFNFNFNIPLELDVCVASKYDI